MAIELPDFWTTLGIGLALLSLVPGMTSVPSVTHIEFKVSRICALAAATLFLVKLALWGSEDLTATRVVLVALLGALIAVSAAYAFHWINKKERTATAAVSHTGGQVVAEVPEKKPESSARRPTLEATNRSVIDATGAQLPADMPFPFARADTDSFISMPGLQVTGSPSGTMVIQSGPVTQQFPPPTGEYSKLTKQELQTEILKASSDLRSFDKVRNAEYTSLIDHFSRDELAKNPKPPKFIQEWEALTEKYRPDNDRFAKLAQSLASECMVRIGTVDGSSLSRAAQHGGAGALNAKFAGPRPAFDAAEFLDELSRRL